MGAPTAKLETVVVASPIKINALVFALITCILLLISLFTDYWVTSHDTKQGLWRNCTLASSIPSLANSVRGNRGIENNFFICVPLNKVFWTQLCGALVAVATVCAGFGVALTFFGFNHQKRQDRKMKFYRSALFVHFVGILCLVLALTIFPLYFVNELSDENESDWYFGWSYGAGWGAVIFLVGASILLICDRNREEIFYKETLYLNEDEENANAPEEQKE